MAKYTDEFGVPRPLIICSGCPMDFRMFNLMVTMFVSGRCGSIHDDADNQLKGLWNQIGYTEWSAARDRGELVLRPFWYALPKMLASIGVSGANDTDTDILPVLQEISALAKEVVGYS